MVLDIFYLVVAIGILWKCADLFVDGAVGLAEWLSVPHMFVGLVIVSLATTSPELMASAMAAVQGNPEIALGNALGSVSLDASLALGLAALLSATPLVTDRKVLASSASMLVAVFILCWYMASDGDLTRLEGASLVLAYAFYTGVFLYILGRRPRKASSELEGLEEIEAHLERMSRRHVVANFVVGLLGVIGGSHLLLEGALGIADSFNISPVITGLVIVAVGTSTPEIATAIASGLKGKSAIGIGNVVGADILNICWVAGLSAVINPLSARPEELQIMFPAVFAIVITMLGLLWFRRGLGRTSGAILIVAYVVYLGVMFFLAPEAPAVVEP